MFISDNIFILKNNWFGGGVAFTLLAREGGKTAREGSGMIYSDSGIVDCRVMNRGRRVASRRAPRWRRGQGHDVTVTCVSRPASANTADSTAVVSSCLIPSRLLLLTASHAHPSRHLTQHTSNPYLYLHFIFLFYLPQLLMFDSNIHELNVKW